MRSIDGDISNDLDGPQPQFQGYGIFEVEYLMDKVTIAHYSEVIFVFDLQC